jgi:hypothetical protein
VAGLLCFLDNAKRALVVAIGGGGDVASAALVSTILERLGVSTVLASIAWERYIYDPVPGPIKLEEILNATARGRRYVQVDGDSYAIRGGRRVVPQAVKAAKALHRHVYVVDMYEGVEGYVKALEEIMSLEGADLVIGVDVGGDSLAGGFEEDLWSPLADWVGLAAISRFSGVLAIHSPGSDGELSQRYILDRIDNVALRGGLLGVYAMCRRDAEVLEKILEFVDSEASRISLYAIRGLRGPIHVRRGSRVVEVTLFNTMTFYLDSRVVVDLIEPVKRIMNTRSLEEARRRLNEMGIYTELDLEEDLAKLEVPPESVTGELLLKVRSVGRERLVKSSR